MADAGHVDTDLVCPPCLQFTFDISVITEPFKDAVMGNRMPAVRRFGAHFFAVHRMTPDGGIHSACILLQIPVHDRMVPPCNVMLLQVVSKDLMGSVVLADQKRSCRVHVDTVYDSGPQHAVNTGKPAAAVKKDCIYKCMAVMAGII